MTVRSRREVETGRRTVPWSLAAVVVDGRGHTVVGCYNRIVAPADTAPADTAAGSAAVGVAAAGVVAAGTAAAVVAGQGGHPVGLVVRRIRA